MKLLKTASGPRLSLTSTEWTEIGRKAHWLPKSAQNLEVVKTPERLTPREATRAIRDAIIAEEGAIKQYETVVDACGDAKVKKILQSIADEERVHVGELQKLLAGLLPDEQEKLDEGAEEVEGE